MNLAPTREWNLRSFLLAAGIYIAVHLALRLLLSPTLLVDDSEQVLFARELAWGYGIGQPPLYTWLAWGLSRLVGPGLLAVSLLKYLLLFAILVYFYLIARRLIGDPRLAWLAGASLVLISPFATRIHEGFTHTVMLSLACAASFHALLRLRSSPTTGNYLLFGLWLAVGWLGKYSFALYFLPLLLAAASLPEYRVLLTDRRLLLALGLMALLLTPHLWWQWAHIDALENYYRGTVQIASNPSWLKGVITGVASLSKAYLYYLFPFALLLPAFPRAWSRLGVGSADERLLGRLLLFALGMMLLQVLLGATYFKARWMHPVLLLFPLWAAVRMERAGYARRGARVLLPATVVITVLIVLFRPIKMFAGPHWEHFSRIHTPMRELSEMVVAEGFSRGTIVANSNFLGAHLALRFPEARVISLDAGYYQPPHRAPAGECLLVWNADHGLQPPPRLRDYVVHTLGTPLPVDATTQVLTAHLYGSDKQVYRLAQLRFTPSEGECR